jgi:hypothetical protein
MVRFWCSDFDFWNHDFQISNSSPPLFALLSFCFAVFKAHPALQVVRCGYTWLVSSYIDAHPHDVSELIWMPQIDIYEMAFRMWDC